MRTIKKSKKIMAKIAWIENTMFKAQSVQFERTDKHNGFCVVKGYHTRDASSLLS